MKYTVKFTKQFKKAEKQNRNLNILKEVVKMLADGEKLPPAYSDHALVGNYQGKRECHLLPDWLLIYEIDNNELILCLVRTGSHSDLF